jgi:hypothetical protein
MSLEYSIAQDRDSNDAGLWWYTYVDGSGDDRAIDEGVPGEGVMHFFERDTSDDMKMLIAHQQIDGTPSYYNYAVIDNIRHYNYSSWSDSGSYYVPGAVEDCYKTEAHSCRQCEASDMNDHFPDSPFFYSVHACKV